MREPIFVYEPDDLDVFLTLRDAELKIEAIDVLDGSFVYFDADGQVLSASVYTDERGIQRTAIRENVQGRFEKAELREIISRFLVACGESKFEIEHLPLDELVGRSTKYAT